MSGHDKIGAMIMTTNIKDIKKVFDIVNAHSLPMAKAKYIKEHDGIVYLYGAKDQLIMFMSRCDYDDIVNYAKRKEVEK
jgi:hypothetical protein